MPTYRQEHQCKNYQNANNQQTKKHTEHNMANPFHFKTGCQEKCGHLFQKVDYQSCYFEGHPVALVHSYAMAVRITQ